MTRPLRAILAVVAIAALSACGGSDNGWTEGQREELTTAFSSDDDFTASQTQCIIDYVIEHWAYGQVVNGSPHARAHGREAGRACR